MKSFTKRVLCGILVVAAVMMGVPFFSPLDAQAENSTAIYFDGNTWIEVPDQSVVAETTLGFEAPLPDGLTASTDRLLGDFVPLNARIADHYASQGVIFEDVGLLYLAPHFDLPETNFIQSYDQNGIIDHDIPYKIKFVSLSDSNILGTTQFFSIDSDRLGGSGLSFTASGYDINGNFLGSSTESDTTFPGLGATVTLQDIGDIHSIILQGAYTIGFDNMKFGTISPNNGNSSLDLVGPLTIETWVNFVDYPNCCWNTLLGNDLRPEISLI
jgi:hypothetical protein